MQQVVVLAAFFVVMFAFLLGMWVDFVPAPFLYGRSWWLSMPLLGALMTAWLFLHAYRRGRLQRLLDKGVWGTALLVLSMPPMFGGLVWLTVGKTLPWAYTRVFGTPFEDLVVMQTHYQSSRRLCDYRLRRGPLAHAFPSYICIDEAFYRRHPEQTVTVALAGRRSAFGAAIIEVYATTPVASHGVR